MSKIAEKHQPTFRAISWQKLKSFLGWQISRIQKAPGKIINHLFGTLWYDLVLTSGKRSFQGKIPDSTRFMVYLIFPKNGLQDSHLKSLTYFCERGYAPIVVSNLPLEPYDRERLLPLTHVLIERPNYGYDFGGYRDGILYLHERLKRMDRLVLMNDSVWFPLSTAQDWLAQVDRANSDVVGAVANCCVAPLIEDPDGAVSWRYNNDNVLFHYCSFSLSFSSSVLKDPSFLNFWRRLKLSNDKFTTIKRGEVGLGQWIIHSGHSHSATLDIEHLDKDLDQLDNYRLRALVDRLIIPEDATLRARKAAILAEADEAQTRQRLKNFMLVATAETGAGYALLDFALKEKGFCFVKKSPLWLDHEGAITTISILEELGEEEVLREARRLARPSLQ